MFKKMVKKIMGFIIGIVLLCSNLFSINVQAANAFYTEQGENLLEYLQTEYPSMLQLNSNYEYVKFINDFNNSWLSQYLLNITDFFANTGAAPDEKKYMEVLLDIIETHDLRESASIANQKKMDNLKTFEDYGKDFAKTSAKAVSAMSKLSDSTDALSQKISKAIDGLSVLDDTTENWIEALSDLETSVQNYSYYSEFLQIIEENSEGELKKAAESLKKNLESGMKIRLEAYEDITNENIKKWGEEYFSDVFFETCKLTEEYETDDTFKWFMDSSQNVIEKFKTIKDSWEIGKAVGILVGDITVGGENLINRLREVMAVNEIGKVLSEKLQDMVTEELDDVIGTKEELDFVQKYVMQSKFLINCRVRGEYCWYSLVANDAGLMSYFNKETGKNIEKMYNGMVAAMEEIDAELDKIMEYRAKESTGSVFEILLSEFELSSGAGGWATILKLNKDGTFTGQYYDSDLGDTGEDYPNGTVHFCNFSGSFTQPEQIDTYTYSMNLEDFEQDGSLDEVYYKDSTKYVCSEPYGFEDAYEFMIYMPEIEMSELPHGFLQWIHYRYGNEASAKTLPYFGIYNVNGEAAFLAENTNENSNENSEEANDKLYGIWLQLDSDDPVVLTLKEDMTMQYYNSVSYENVYNSTFEWNNGLYLNLLNITDMNATSVPYQVEVNETKNPLQMILTVDNTEDFPDTTQLYGMEKILEGTYERISFSNEQLEAIKTKLGVPADMEVHIIQNPPYFWDAGQCWLVQVDIYDKNNQYLAGAAFDSKTMEICKNIYMYAGF